MAHASDRTGHSGSAGVVRVALAFGIVLGLAHGAAGQARIGYVTNYDGSILIADDYIPWLIDFYFEDGSKGNLTNGSNNFIVLAQCYAGDHLDNYNATAHDESAGGVFFDSATFTNTTVLAGDLPGEKTIYHFACDLTDDLRRSRTAGEVLELVRNCKTLLIKDNPQIQGSETRRVGGASSTHVLVWASQPDAEFDIPNIANIARRFPPAATTTVTVLSGDGSPAQTGAPIAGVTYGPATRSALEDAMELIGARMDDGPDEQFILFMLDHGGKAVISPDGKPIPVADPPAPGERSLSLSADHAMLAAIRENAAGCNATSAPGCQPHLSLFTTQVPGVGFALGDLSVTLQRPGAAAVDLGPIDSGDVYFAPLGNGTPRYELRFPLTQSALFGASPGMIPRDGFSYTITLSNWSPVTPIGIDVAGLFSGAIPKDDVPSSYPSAICGNDPALGCSKPVDFFRMNEVHGAGVGPQAILNYAGPSGPADGYWNFGDTPGSSDIGSAGPESPAHPGLEIGNRAPYFDGNDDQILAFSSRGPRSVTGLFKPDIAAPGTMASKYEPVGDQRAFSLKTDAAGRVEFRVSQDGRGDPLHEAAILSSAPLPTGSWTQVTASVGDEGMNLCFDGRQVAGRTYGVPTFVPDNAVPLSIGLGFDGQIDELAFSSTAFAAPHCEGLADLYLGELSSAFGYPATGNGGVKVGRNARGGVEVGPFDDSGSAFVSLDVSNANVLEQGFNFGVDADLLPIIRTAIGTGVGGTTGLGSASITSIGSGQGGLAASFGTLNVPTVTVTVLQAGIPVGSFTVASGPIGTMPLRPLTEIGVLDGSKPWGYRMAFAGSAPVTRFGGGAVFTGDEIWFTAPGVLRSSLGPIGNVDLGGSSISKVEILDAVDGPLPEPVPGDVDGDGDVDQRDLEILLANYSTSDPSPEADLDGDGTVGMEDLRLVLGNLGGPAGALAGATAAPAVAPLLALQTGTPAVQVGQPVALDLVLANLTGTVGAFALEVRYDATAFALEDVSFGSALGALDTSLDHSIDAGAQTAVFAFDKPGAVQLYVLSLLDAAQLALLQSGTLTLASLDFTALAPASVSFDAAAVDLVDGAQPPVDLAPLTQGVQVEVTCANADGDALCNAADNCPFLASANNADTDGDGRGNACECTDQDGDGLNTVSDLVAINLAIFNPALVTPLCDGNGDTLCDVLDIIAANIEIFSPTSTSTCAHQPVAGP